MKLIQELNEMAKEQRTLEEREMFGRMRKAAGDFAERMSWTPNHIQDSIMKFGVDTVARYIEELPIDQKERVTAIVEKWLRKNPNDPFTYKMEHLLDSLSVRATR